MPEEQSINAIEEVNILGSVSCSNIVTYYDSFISDNGNINILMEYCSKGDLCSFLESRKGKMLSEKYIWKFFIQIWLGLYHMHKNNIIHRDLKSLNVFLTKDYSVKIGDMGAAKIVENCSESKLKSKVGTPYYLSPEIWQNQYYSHKSDIWALGWILYELWTLEKPFLAETQDELMKNILTGKYKRIEDCKHEELPKLVNYMLQKNPENRPSIQQILKLEVIQEKAKECKITLPVKRMPTSPNISSYYRSVLAKRAKKRINFEGHKSQQSILQSRNSSSKYLYRPKRIPKSKQNSVVLEEKWMNDSDFFTQISTQITDIVIEKSNPRGGLYRLRKPSRANK